MNVTLEVSLVDLDPFDGQPQYGRHLQQGPGQRRCRPVEESEGLRIRSSMNSKSSIRTVVSRPFSRLRELSERINFNFSNEK